MKTGKWCISLTTDLICQSIIHIYLIHLNLINKPEVDSIENTLRNFTNHGLDGKCNAGRAILKD